MRPVRWANAYVVTEVGIVATDDMARKFQSLCRELVSPNFALGRNPHLWGPLLRGCIMP